MELAVLTRPLFISDAHLTYLDNLRESGVTNMFGASIYIEEEFGLPPKISSSILKYWMLTFGKEDR